MKKLFYLFTLLAIASCGNKQEKSENSSMETAETKDVVSCPFGNIPEIYGDAFERMTELQEQIQLAYKSGGSPSQSTMEEMIETPKKAKAKAEEEIKDVKGNKIAVESYDYGFVNITGAEITDVGFSSNNALVNFEIQFIPGEGYDFKSLPKGSTVYYLCLTEDNTLLFMNAMHFPSTGKTKIGLSANVTTKKKSSPAVWKNFAKIKFVSKDDFYAMMSMR